MSEYNGQPQPRILLVEDHAFQLIGMELQLNRMGYFNLTPAMDKDEALDLIKNRAPYDLLLCDQHLPDGLGIELIEQAYKLGGIGHAILFSGIETGDQLESLSAKTHTLNLPHLMCMSKPLNSAAINRVLDALWNHSQQ